MSDDVFNVPYPEPIRPRVPRRIGRISHQALVERSEEALERMLAQPNVPQEFVKLVAAARRQRCTLAHHRRFGWCRIPLEPDSDHIEQAAQQVESERHEGVQSVEGFFQK